MPKASVIIANHNKSKYIANCLNSVQHQSLKDIEIIVADDGSTDDSVEVVKNIRAKDSRVVLLENEYNRGVSWTRDHAIRNSRSDFFTTLDSDDFYVDPFKIEAEFKLVSKFKQSGRKVCAYSCELIVNEAGVPIFLKNRNIQEGNLFEEILTRNIPIPRDFLVARESYFDVGGYDYDMNLYEDWDLKIRIAREVDFYYTGRIGTAYRLHNTGLSSVEPIRHAKVINEIFKKYSKNLSFLKRKMFKLRNEIWMKGLVVKALFK